MKTKTKLFTFFCISAFLFVACKREEAVTRSASPSNTSEASTFFTEEEGVEDGAIAILNDFWVNYAQYKGNTDYLSDLSPALDSRVSDLDASYTLHYVLNVAMANPDSVYDDPQ